MVAAVSDRALVEDFQDVLSGPKLQGRGPIRSFEQGEEPKMADSALFVGWNQPARGREAGAVAAFGEGVQYFGELAARGEIESFEPFFLDAGNAHGGDLNGFFLVRGERASLDRLRYDDERFRSWIAKAQLNVDGIGVLGAVTGETLGQQMAVFTEAVAGLN